MGLVTIAELTASMGTAIGQRGDAQFLIDAASAAVENYCRRTFAQGSVDERIDGTGTDTLRVSRPPIGSVTSVTLDGEALDNTDGSEWTVGKGVLFRGNGQSDTLSAEVWPRGRRNVRVQYSGGYATIPDEVKFATMLVVRQLVEGLGSAGLVLRERIGDYEIEYQEEAFDRIELPGPVRALLGPFRLMP